MKKLILLLVAGLFMSFANLELHAQATANVQIIHNSADPAASSVDIYLNGQGPAAIPGVAFRTATPFTALPAGIPVTVGIAPGGSTGPGDIIASFPFTLTSGENYVIVATGVLDPMNFDASVNGMDIAFDLKVLTPARMMGTAGNVDIVAIHGATDAPAVDVLVNGNTMMPLIDSLEYGAYSGYASVPPSEYILDIALGSDNSTTVASYYADLSGLGGGSAVVFASGFLNSTNNQNGAGFGLFAALANGTVVEFASVGSAHAQVIHNSADPVADSVDVYINYVSDSLKLDNFAFRTATPFVDLPSGYPVSIGIAPKNSASSAEAIATFSPTLMDGETYLVVANGVLDPNNFAANPDGASTAFNLWFEAGAREVAAGTGVDLKVLHGATDAPSVGVNANGNAAVDSAAYGDFTGYLSVPASRYRIDVTGAKNPGALVAPFYVDASTLGGGAAVVFASGFLDPSANQNGEAFGLFAAFADGTVAPLTAVGTARAQVIHNSADIAADTVDVYINALADTIVLNDFAFRTATPFVDLPSGYPVDVVIAGKNSTGIADGIATIPVTAENMGSYYIVANGVLDPMMYAANPDGINTGFGLFVADSAREVGVGTDVDIRVFHGATDAPTVDVLANYSTPALVSGAAYTDFTGYLSVPPADYDLSITPAGDNSNLLFNFDADVSGLGGGAGLILASGFVDPTANQDGEGFGLLLVLADGMTILLDMTTGLNDDLEVANQYINVYPNPANGKANLDYQLVKNGKVDISVIDIAGRTVFNKNLNSAFAGKYTLDLPVQEMANGIYTVVMKTEGTISMKKLVVRN